MYLNINMKSSKKIAAIDMAGAKVTYGELVSFMGNFTNKLHLERELAFIFSHNDIPTLCLYLACMENRIVPLLLSPKIEATLLRRLFSVYQPAYVFGRTGELTGIRGEISKIDFPFSVSEQYQCIHTGNILGGLYEDLSLLLTTSGSTGSPKLVRHSYSNIGIQAENVAKLFEMDGTERHLVNLPMMYTMGLSAVNSHLYAGATLLLTDENILSREFMSFFAENETTGYTGVPYSYELLHRLRFTSMNFPKLSLLTQGGGKMKKELWKEFCEYITRQGGRFIATYGQTEGSARMAYLPPEYALKKIGSIGRSIPGGKLYLVDDYGNRVTEPYVQGEMYYEGPNVTLGYAESRGDLIKGNERNGVLPTGDLAYFDEDGMFFISGRIKRILKLFGHRVSLDECERMVRDNIGLECACVGDDNKMIVYIETDSDTENVKKVLLDKTQLYPVCVEVRRIVELPRTASGKVDYAALEK